MLLDPRAFQVHQREGHSSLGNEVPAREPDIIAPDYEGPASEDGSRDSANAGKIVLRSTNQWIVDKKALETVWTFEVPGLPKFTGKMLTTWDPAAKRIVGGGVSSMGGYSLATITYDAETKTWTNQSEGVDGEGRKVSSTAVMRLTDPDTYLWRWKGRAGDDEMQTSVEWTFKRVKK